MAQELTLMMASWPSSMRGSGTVSQRMSPLPCHVIAFMRRTLPLRWRMRVWRGAALDRGLASAITKFTLSATGVRPIEAVAKF